MEHISDVAWLRGIAKSGSFASTQPERVLARLLTMTEDYKRYGFRFLSSGYFGSVLTHRKTPGVVYKLCLATFGGYRKRYHKGYMQHFVKDASDGYAGWAGLCAEYQQEFGPQPFLPSIKEIIHDAKCSVYVMDTLTECPDKPTGKGWAMFFNDFFDTEDVRYDSEFEHFHLYDEHPCHDAMVDFRDWLQDRLPSSDMCWDIHRHNVMMRGDIPVLTDPWAHVHPNCSQASALTRKFNNSVGITA